MTNALLKDFKTIADGIYLEGLAIDHERDQIWYSDVIGGGVHGITPHGYHIASFNPGRMWTGGVLMNSDGSILSSGGGGIMWNNPDSGKSGWLLDTIDGERVNGINEMVPDGTGGIFFGTSDIERVIAGQATRPTAIYRLSADRRLTKLADDVRFSNGMMLDAERRRFYCNSSFDGTLAFDVSADFTLANGSKLVDKPDCDGMTLDADGNLWLTGFKSGFFERVSADGNIIQRALTPAGAITQIRFGGKDGRDVYFNSVPVEGGSTLKKGGQLTGRNSFMYKARSALPGRKVLPANFKLV